MILRWFVTFYLVGLVAFGAGLYVAVAKVWPYNAAREVFQFVKGHRDEISTLWDKLISDAGVRPQRFLKEYRVGDPSRFRAVDGLPLAERRIAPLAYSSESMDDGYVYVVGKFDFVDGMNGAVLLSSKGKLVNRWVIPDQHNPENHHHLFHIARDGSILTAPDNDEIRKFDWCGNEVWVARGNFHHSIHPIGDGRFWVTGSTHEKDAIAIINGADGSVERTILLSEIHAVEDSRSPLFRLTERDARRDYWHNNDVEPLLPSMASAFPEFEVGDLAISYRHPNLVYVIGGNDLSVKWRAQSRTAQQHDIDWQPNGSWTVFDNRNGLDGDYSNIVAFRPQSEKPSILLDGKKYGFYSRIGGKHEIYETGKIMALSYSQGRILFVARDGAVAFEIVNRYSTDESLFC